MSIVSDTIALYRRELLIFKKNLITNTARAIIFPAVLILIFGNLGNNYLSHTKIAVVEYTYNQYVTQLLSSIESTGQFDVVAVTDQRSALSMLSNGTVDAVLVIEPSSNGISSPPSVIIYYSDTNFEVSGVAVSALESAAESISKSAQVAIKSINSNVQSSLVFSKQISYSSYLTGGIVVMVAVFGSVFGAGVTLITDKQIGFIKRVSMSPANKNAILLSKILYGLTVSTLYGIIALAIGILNGAQIAAGPIAITYIVVILALISLGFSSLSTLIAVRINRVDAFTIFANVITLPLWLLSGAFFPTTAFPKPLQFISNIDPMTYASQGIRYLMISGYYPANYQILDLSILIGFSLVLFIIASYMFKSVVK
ncbi:MAG: putative ABC transporter permease [Candidatus Micrarchaeota archaeon]|nr:MAG: putative ABC transporter permease [Candidatus Micrarchaeota archaeon]